MSSQADVSEFQPGSQEMTFSHVSICISVRNVSARYILSLHGLLLKHLHCRLLSSILSTATWQTLGLSVNVMVIYFPDVVTPDLMKYISVNMTSDFSGVALCVQNSHLSWVIAVAIPYLCILECEKERVCKSFSSPEGARCSPCLWTAVYLCFR